MTTKPSSRARAMRGAEPQNATGSLRAPAYEIRYTNAKSILTKTSGFIAQAGFSHSLSPARNCTYGCIYCYVPTMRIYGGLRPEDWRRWGQYTTFKSNSAELLRQAVRPEQTIYCSPLVDPYQPVEESEGLMPRILDVLLAKPPKVFVIQTRSPLILRDLDRLIALQSRTCLKVSFSLTTNREAVRKLYEPLCATIGERVATLRRLRNVGVSAYATLAPLLPCDPEELTRLAIECTDRDLIGDPFHIRATKRHGATTREAAARVSDLHRFSQWHEPDFQKRVIERIRRTARAAGRRFGVGPEGFVWLAADDGGG